MTITTQEEARKWFALGPGAGRPGLPPGALVLTDPGLVEIKPHTATGIRAGLKQLAARLDKANLKSGVLATYMGADSLGRRLSLGRPKCLHVYATVVNATPPRTPTPSLAQYSHPGRWHDLGLTPLPDKIDHPRVDHAPAFGWAVEPVVQRHVAASRITLRTPLRKWTPLGGPGAGADMKYDELADFYRELAHELRDPLFAELASELEAMAA
jgi:hypothetical protein